MDIQTRMHMRVHYGSSFDTSSFPAAKGAVIRWDEGGSGGIGFELFFVYGTAKLYFRCESGGGWHLLQNAV